VADIIIYLEHLPFQVAMYHHGLKIMQVRHPGGNLNKLTKVGVDLNQGLVKDSVPEYQLTSSRGFAVRHSFR